MSISNNRAIEAMGKVTLTTFVDEEVKEGLKALADAEKRSMSQMAAILIEEAVDKARKDGRINTEKPQPKGEES